MIKKKEMKEYTGLEHQQTPRRVDLNFDQYGFSIQLVLIQSQIVFSGVGMSWC